jgi:hypothetical protein
MILVDIVEKGTTISCGAYVAAMQRLRSWMYRSRTQRKMGDALVWKRKTAYQFANNRGACLRCLSITRDWAVAGATLSKEVVNTGAIYTPTLGFIRPRVPEGASGYPSGRSVPVAFQPSCSKQADLTSSTPRSQSLLEETADLFENLLAEACVESTPRLLPVVSSLSNRGNSSKSCHENWLFS